MDENTRKSNLINENYLYITGLQVMLYLEQSAAGIKTTLSQAEFITLVNQREAARAAIVLEHKL